MNKILNRSYAGDDHNKSNALIWLSEWKGKEKLKNETSVQSIVREVSERET